MKIMKNCNKTCAPQTQAHFKFQDPETAIEIREPVASGPSWSHTIAELKDPFLSPGGYGWCPTMN